MVLVEILLTSQFFKVAIEIRAFTAPAYPHKDPAVLQQGLFISSITSSLQKRHPLPSINPSSSADFELANTPK